MERDEIGRKQEISEIDGTNWNWKEPRNLKNRWKEMELEGTWKSQKRRKEMKQEGTWKSQKEMEGTGTGRNLEISKIDGRKEELEGILKSQNQMI